MGLKAILGVAGVDPHENKLAVKVGNYFSYLVIIALVAIVVQLVVDFSTIERGDLWLSILVWTIFAVELTVNTWLVNDKKRYLKTNWLNVAIIIFAFPWLPVENDWALALRILRLMLFLRVASDILYNIIQVLKHNNFGIVLGIASIFIVLAGAIFSVIENTDLSTGLWYALVTVTTVGYGDVVPITDKGQIFGALLIVLGVVLFSLVTANISAFLIGSTQRTTEKDILNYVKDVKLSLAKQAEINEEQFTRALHDLMVKIEALQDEHAAEAKERVEMHIKSLEGKLISETNLIKKQLDLIEERLK